MKLVLPDASHEAQYNEMMEEWLAEGGRLNPGALRSNGVPYEKWLRWMKDDAHEATCPPGSMPQTLYFGLTDDGLLVGAVTIRHGLDKRNRYDGHVGLGVRPRERRKGYATALLRLALDELTAIGIRDILLSCASDNIGSERTILACGAAYEKTVRDHGQRTKLFWLHLQ